MNKHQELEQQILNIWEIDKDIKTLADSADWTAIDPIFMDRLLSIASVYEMRVERLWGVYEEALQEYYNIKNLNDARDINFNEPSSCLDSAYERKAMEEGLVKNPVFPENQLDEYPDKKKDR